MAMMGAVGGLLSGAMGAAGSIFEGQSQAAAIRENARAQQFADFANIMLLERKKAQVREQAAYSSWVKEEQTKQTVAEATGGMMQNNIDIGGSNLAVLNQIRDIGTHQRMLEIYNGDVKAWEIGIQQTMIGMKSQMQMQVAERNAQSAQTAGFVGGMSKLISAGIGAFSPRGVGGGQRLSFSQMDI